MQLIGGLSDEKVRWHESVLAFDAQIVNIVGDVMISSGVIAYLGTFTVRNSFAYDSWCGRSDLMFIFSLDLELPINVAFYFFLHNL